MATEFLKMWLTMSLKSGNSFVKKLVSQLKLLHNENYITPIRILQIIIKISDRHYEWLRLTSATAATTLGNSSGNSGSDDISGGLNGTAFPSPPTLKTGVPQGFMDHI